MNGTNMKLVIWDTAGQERYHALNQVYYRGSEGNRWDITCKAHSWSTISPIQSHSRKWTSGLWSSRRWSRRIFRLSSQATKQTSKIVKSKKRRRWRKHTSNFMTISYAKQMGCPHFNTSAKTGMNVQEIFTTLADSKSSTWDNNRNIQESFNWKSHAIAIKN